MSWGLRAKPLKSEHLRLIHATFPGQPTSMRADCRRSVTEFSTWCRRVTSYNNSNKAGKPRSLDSLCRMVSNFFWKKIVDLESGDKTLHVDMWNLWFEKNRNTLSKVIPANRHAGKKHQQRHYAPLAAIHGNGFSKVSGKHCYQTNLKFHPGNQLFGSL